MQRYNMWIGGEWVEAESSKTYTAVNPATAILRRTEVSSYERLDG